MNNQQVTDVELGWLAGAFDADGHMGMHLYLYAHKKNRHGTFRNSHVQLGFTNTDTQFLCKVKRICSKLGCGMHIQSKASAKKANHSPAWVVRTGKITVIARLLNAIIPYLTVKQERATILLDYCLSRIELKEKTKAKNLHAVARQFPMTKDDLWHFEKFKQLNKRITPTTILQGSRTQASSKRKTHGDISWFLSCDDIV